MKLEHTYQNIITELQGISPQARAWSRVLEKIINNTAQSNLLIMGEDYPDAYQNFPVDVFYITKRIEYGNGGAYDEQKSGYDEKGNYCVYILIGSKDVEETLNHELRHAFEDYNRISNKRTPLSKTKETQQFYNSDFEKVLTGKVNGDIQPFKNIFFALHHTSKIEESAYSETVYDKKTDILDRLKAIKQRKYLSKLNDNELAIRWLNLKSQVRIPILDKFNNHTDFIRWADETIQRRVDKVYKKLIKVHYLSNMQ